MKRIFADTFYFLALLNMRDEAHHRAASFALGEDVELHTTAWVLTELADGLASTNGREVVAGLLDELRRQPRSVFVEADAGLWQAGVELYRQRDDKPWSLTDCISFEYMKKAGLVEALTGDHHFRQAGFVALLV